MFLFFFFQAEDGIRDVAVTGVQTCALPICFRHDLPSGARDRGVCEKYPGTGQLPVGAAWEGHRPRSEEHTSELQSRLHLVCRLLLEKKKQIKKTGRVVGDDRQMSVRR